jgi:hypothetical protein
LWIAAPALALWASRSPTVGRRLAISDPDAHYLRLTARRTWRYFETFVTAAENNLPPDNFQEDPTPVIAQRTSPTNLGSSPSAPRQPTWVCTCFQQWPRAILAGPGRSKPWRDWKRRSSPCKSSRGSAGISSTGMGHET